jgi:hypothetical protein
MTGLSMGGGYTLSTTMLWPEIKAAACSGGFRHREGEPKAAADLSDFRADDRLTRAMGAALICPRPLMIQSGEADAVVPVEGARRGAPIVRAYYEKLGVEDRFELDVHPDGHVFENEAIFRFFDTHLR